MVLWTLLKRKFSKFFQTRNVAQFCFCMTIGGLCGGGEGAVTKISSPPCRQKNIHQIRKIWNRNQIGNNYRCYGYTDIRSLYIHFKRQNGWTITQRSWSIFVLPSIIELLYRILWKLSRTCMHRFVLIYKITTCKDIIRIEYFWSYILHEYTGCLWRSQQYFKCK